LRPSQAKQEVKWQEIKVGRYLILEEKQEKLRLCLVVRFDKGGTPK
jgi:hypothetical protein